MNDELYDRVESTLSRDPYPTIVITRHPDFVDEINLYELDDVRVVYLDLGSEFNGTPDTYDQAREWALSVWEAAKDLPADHPARAEVREVIGYTVEDYLDVGQLDALLQ